MPGRRVPSVALGNFKSLIVDISQDGTFCMPAWIDRSYLETIGGAILAVFSGALAESALAGNAPCPLILGNDYHAGRYEFSYKSWYWFENKSGQYRLRHCVRNENKVNAIFVEWEGTGLRGFIRPNDTNHVSTTYRDDGFDQVKRTIWYGSSLRSKVAETSVRKSDHADASRSFVPPIRSRFIRVAAAKDRPTQHTLTAESKVSIPNFAVVGDLAFRDLIKAVEDDPSLLMTFKMRFRSEVVSAKGDRKTGGIVYTCEYEISGSRAGAAIGTPKLTIEFTDTALQKIMFKTAYPLVITEKWRRGSGRAVKFSGSVDIPYGIKAASLETRSARLVLKGPSGQKYRIGSVPVTYFSYGSPVK